MTPRTIRLLDRLAVALLLLWAGAALGFGLLAPLLFRELPSRDLAGRIAGLMVARLDWAAWGAFGLAGILSWGTRWLAEMKEEVIGPLRLWSAAWLVALVMCLASSAVVTPKLGEIRARMGAPVDTLAPANPDRVAYDKAHGLSRQLFFLRILLALGLAGTVGLLPGRQAGEPTA